MKIGALAVNELYGSNCLSIEEDQSQALEAYMFSILAWPLADIA